MQTKTKIAGIILCGAIFLFPSAGFCGSPEPFAEGGKWGYREAASGATVVPPIFDAAEAFSEGLAPVMLIGKWGYLNESGQFTIEPKYSGARPFSAGAAEVMLEDGSWAVIDASGNLKEVSAAVEAGGMSEGLEAFEMGGLYGYRDARGRTVIEPAFERAGSFSGGLARVKSGGWGMINRSGRFVVRPGYAALRDFSGARAAFLRDGRWGYLDRKGREPVPPVYHEAGDFSEGLAAVRLNARWGYVDEDGRLVLPAEYVSAGGFSGGLAPVTVQAAGEALSSLTAEPAWIDRGGERVYRSAGAAGDDLFILVSTSGLFGCASGKSLLLPPVYAAVAGCSSGLCLVRKDTVFEFVNYKGEPVLATDFDAAVSLDCGVYRVRRGGKYGLLSASGTVLAEPAYDAITGSACDNAIVAYFAGAGGQLDARSGVFTAGLPEPAPAAVELSTRCLQAEILLNTTDYVSLASRCDRGELMTLNMERPGCLTCRLALAEVYLSTAGGAPDRSGALKVLEEAMEISSSPAAYAWHARLLMETGAPSEAALAAADYRRLTALEPDVAEHYAGACAAYALAGSSGAASGVYYCDKAIELGAGAEGYVNRARVRNGLGDNGGALDDLRAAIQLCPEDTGLRLARARMSAAVGQDYRTVFDCSKVLELDPANIEALEARAMAYLRAQDCPRAFEDLQAAGRIRPGGSHLQMLAAYSWACEQDLYKTIGIADELLRMGEECGGPCWPPAGYEPHLTGFYETEAHRELLKRYAPAEEAAAGEAMPAPAAPDAALPGVPPQEAAKVQEPPRGL